MKADRQDKTNDVRHRLAANIRERREQLSLTQAQLAQRAQLGVAQIVSSIERSERDVKALELAAIAKALHCDLVDLFDDAMDQPPVVAWRERPVQGADDQAAQFIRLSQFYQLAEEWTHEERSCRLPDVVRPHGTPTVLWARATAEETRKALDLGSLPAASLYQTLEERCGVKIFYFPNLSGSAACACGNFGAAIALNASDGMGRRNFSLAHELFHLLTWAWLVPGEESVGAIWPDHVERLANAFASSLLLPEPDLVKALDVYREKQAIAWRGLVTVARQFLVSTEALLWRLVNLNMLTEKFVRGLLSDPEFRSADRAPYPAARKPETLPDRFLRLLEIAYLQGTVSAGRIAEMTGQSLSRVHHWLSQLEEEGEVGAGQLVHLT